MLNILIRTSYRPMAFNRLIESIERQSYKEVRVIVGYDDDRALSYIPDEFTKIKLIPDKSVPFFYDNYCNDLKDLVTDGWFIFIDDDDFILDPKAFEVMSRHLTGTDGVICQFSRNGRLKPSNDLIKSKTIKRAKIGMPCLLLHHSKKNIATFNGALGAPDYFFIKDISERVKLKFVPIVIVHSWKRSNGKMEN